MKSFKQKLILFLISVMIVCACSFTSIACDNNDNPPIDDEKNETYTCVVNYNNDQGTVTLSPQKDKYAKDENVTIKVTPKTGFSVNKFYINVPDLTTELLSNPVGDGFEYTLKISENTDISVTFNKLGSKAYTIDKGIIASSQGTVTLNPQKNVYYENEIVTVSVINNKGFDIKQFKVNGVDHQKDLLLNKCIYSIMINDEVCNSEKVINLEILFEKVNYNVVKEINYINFDNVIEKDLVIVDFFTDWCVNCPSISSAFQILATMDTGARLCKIDADSDKPSGSVQRLNYEKVMVKYGLVGWPNVGLFKNGKFIGFKDGGGDPTAKANEFAEWIEANK